MQIPEKSPLHMIDASVPCHRLPIFFERQNERLIESWLSILIIAAIGLALFLQFCLVFKRQINWDEFNFLSHIYEYRRGSLVAPLQTFYVHLFNWLPLVIAGEINQIIFARLIMLTLHACTLGLLYYIARRFTSQVAALLGVLSYTACGYVLLHGAAFRADPIATGLLVASIAILLIPQMSRLKTVATGIAVAVACLITIKSVLFLPVVTATAALRLIETKNRHVTFFALAIGGVIAIAALLILFELHRISLGSALHANVLGHARGDFKEVFGGSISDPTLGYFLAALALNPLTFAAIAAGIGFCTWYAFTGGMGARYRYSLLLVFGFPFATLFFYRNSFPYYYVFALASATALSAVAFERIHSPVVKLICVALLVGAAIAQFLIGLTPGQAVQRATLSAVHRLFPKPVFYIDGYSAVSSFPKVGFFMSTWGMENYRSSGRNVIANAIIQYAPPLVVADSPVLQRALTSDVGSAPPSDRLLKADAAALRQNYIHQWGCIWVAGKTIDRLSADSEQSLSIMIPGAYTIAARATILIDGRAYAPGEIIALHKGIHSIRSENKNQAITLRWGAHLPLTAKAGPQQPFFAGFRP